MEALEQLTSELRNGVDLPAEQTSEAARFLTHAEVPAEAKKDFLKALARKGETSSEVAAFARAFREWALDPEVDEWAARAIDVCGTGGDGSGTFNISTAVSFVVAAAGVPVFKHGNRSITSKCGSADLLEALGIRLDAPHPVLRESLRALKYCFFFAPAFHPAFKEIMPVRKALAAEGQRSIFNLLGPLINPGRPAFQLLGVFSENWVQPLGETLECLGLKAGLVAHGKPLPGVGLDELSCAGLNTVHGFGHLAGISGGLTAGDGGLPECELEALKGGDVEANVNLLKKLLGLEKGEVPEGLRNTVLLNAGAALWIAGSAASLKEGVRLADALLADGSVGRWLRDAQEFYANH